jgi:hypothetical protein
MPTLEIEVRTMKTAAIHRTVAIALVGALALPVSLSTPARQTEAKTELAQYCVPPEGAFDTHRFYCQFSGG